MMINLRQDPFERAHRASMLYDKWGFDHLFVLVPAQAFVGQFLQTLYRVPAASIAGQFFAGPGHGGIAARPAQISRATIEAVRFILFSGLAAGLKIIKPLAQAHGPATKQAADFIRISRCRTPQTPVSGRLRGAALGSTGQRLAAH